MLAPPLKILLAEDNVSEAETMNQRVARAESFKFKFDRRSTLAAAASIPFLTCYALRLGTGASEFLANREGKSKLSYQL